LPLNVTPRLTRVVLRLQGSTLQISVDDRLTNKQLERELELAALPLDTWALAVASSVDELLRASWIELALPDAPRPSTPPPAAIVQVLQQSLPTAPEPAVLELGVEAMADVMRDRTAFAGKLRALRWLSAEWGVLGSVGAGFGLRRTSQHGSVRADSLGLELGVAYAPFGYSQTLGLQFEASAAALRMAFAATPKPSADARSFMDISVHANARARGFFDLSWLRISLAVGLVYGLRPTRALDESHVVTGDQGFGLEVLTAIGVMR
jgi:hypothetical protein